MAPHIETDYHSAQETNAVCSLRILKRRRKNVSQPKDVSDSDVSGREEFFEYLGLQMRRFECPYSTLHGVQQNIKNPTRRTDGLKLRDCSVVVLGATCNICGKCFKCETDLNEHVASKHYVYTETVSTARKDEQENSELCQRVCQYYRKRRSKENVATKLQNKKRLIFRIGKEVVVDTYVERKHLKWNSIATQTEPAANPTELITKTNSSKGDVPGIDHTVFDNSPCQCCTATICVSNGTNRYIAGNFVEKYPTESEEIARCNATCRNDRLTAIYRTGILSSNSIPIKSDSESSKSSSKPTKSVIDSVTLTMQSQSRNNTGSEIFKETEKLLQRSSGVNTVQLMMPVILPIIVPHQTSSIQEQYSRSSFNDEPISDDEVQEVLRIVRGHDHVAKEINHESPNRCEQEMLARNVIKDMLRMEQQSWRLLESEDDVDAAKRRRRASSLFDTRNAVVVDEITKKTNSVGSENNIVKSVTKERNISKESFAKLHKSSHDKLSVSENAKENVLTCNGNISIPSETLVQYSANYYIDACEINNNTETAAARMPVTCLFIPRNRSTGIENISNRPTVIDLVNDTDE